MQTFDFISLETKQIECEECGWRGKGYETDKGYASLPEVIEILCPVCGHFLGEVRKERNERGESY